MWAIEWLCLCIGIIIIWIEKDPYWCLYMLESIKKGSGTQEQNEASQIVIIRSLNIFSLSNVKFGQLYREVMLL